MTDTDIIIEDLRRVASQCSRLETSVAKLAAFDRALEQLQFATDVIARLERENAKLRDAIRVIHEARMAECETAASKVAVDSAIARATQL